VVAVVLADRLHGGVVGLRLLHRSPVGAHQPRRAAGGRRHGARTQESGDRLWYTLRYYYHSDNCIPNFMGYAVPVPQFRACWWSGTASGGEQEGGSHPVRWSAFIGGEQAQDLPHAGRSYSACLHVPHSHSARVLNDAAVPDVRWRYADVFGGRGLQDEALLLLARHLAHHLQPVREQLLDHPVLQAHQGLHQIRLLPDHVGDRRSADAGVYRARRCEHGRAQEAVVVVWWCQGG